PMVTRLSVTPSVANAALQSRAAAAARRSGSRATAAACAGSHVHSAVSLSKVDKVATKLLVAATLSSGPAPIGKTTSHVAASGEFNALTIPTVRAPDALALCATAIRSWLSPDCDTTRHS